MERPLRLNFQINGERLEGLFEGESSNRANSSGKKKGKNLQYMQKTEERQQIIKDALSEISSDKVYKNREEFILFFKGIFQIM